MTRSGSGSAESDTTSASERSFARVLEDFKRDGCLLLVTGDVPEPVSARANRKLLGTPTEFRHRILAVTDPAVSEPQTHLPGSLDAESDGVVLIDARTNGRRGGVDAVADAIRDALPADPPTDEGNVRFALATLVPFVTDTEIDDEVVTALNTLRTAAHAVNAIGAIHLPLPDDHPDVDALTPSVDARIEVRDTNTALPEQRWYLPEQDATTNWVTM